MSEYLRIKTQKHFSRIRRFGLSESSKQKANLSNENSFHYMRKSFFYVRGPTEAQVIDTMDALYNLTLETTRFNTGFLNYNGSSKNVNPKH